MRVFDRHFYLTPCSFGLIEPVRSRVFPSLPDHIPDAMKLLRQHLVRRHDLIERISNFAFQTHPITGETDGKVSIAHGLQCGKHSAELQGRCAVGFFSCSLGLSRSRGERSCHLGAPVRVDDLVGGTFLGVLFSDRSRQGRVIWNSGIEPHMREIIE